MDIKGAVRCAHCGSVISERKIALFCGMVVALRKVYNWAKKTGRHEFKRSDIKHLFISENETARFGDWVYFGGLVYKQGKGQYGLDMKRCRDFFAKELMVPLYVWKNPITKTIRPRHFVTIENVPNLSKFLDEDNNFVAEYK